jgi:hypothetical protein
MYLKPQDTLIALKYWSLRKAALQNSVRQLAESIGVSAGEVSKGAKRLVVAHLLVERDGTVFAETGALLEWLSYGVRYAYPQENAGYGRGMATSWNCPLLVSKMVPPNPALVWASQAGETEGISIRPIHDSVPIAASNDNQLYQILSLLEAIRGGRPRELAIARDLLAKLLGEK